jgi:hypothetical protein
LRLTRVVCRDERSKKFAPEEIKGAQRRRIVIQRRQKGQNLLWKKKRARSREQIGHSTFLSSALASVQLGTYICAFSWAAASTPLTMAPFTNRIHLRAKSKCALAGKMPQSASLVGAMPVHI